MSGWIKFEKSLDSDPRLKRMARKYRNAHVTHEHDAEETPQFYITLMLGGLARLWFYADTHIRDGDVLEVTVDDIDEIVGIKGFAQVLPLNWLQILDADSVKLPDFHEHNGTRAKKKALGTERVARHRQKVALESVKSKRKSNSDVTLRGLPDQDQDQDQDQDPKSQNRSAAKPPSKSEPEWFTDFKNAYPKRGGDPNWHGALRAAQARIREGHSASEFIAGASRYATFCATTGKIGTEYVKQAATFLGPAKPFLDPWTLPATVADNRLRSNLSEAEEFMRRTEPREDAA